MQNKLEKVTEEKVHSGTRHELRDVRFMLPLSVTGIHHLPPHQMIGVFRMIYATILFLVSEL